MTIITADFIVGYYYVALKLLIPFFFVIGGPDAAKAIWELEWEDISLTKKVWDYISG